ncbi:SDR family oxidoreductase [Gordonia sp. ABSL11-1]|uniref:SDR family NAD(P)-dependent oxidoreductase n=1 Tax=Gordonia sp. ABSL11-1 TaxID=3053924 RepID=UPI002572DD32|nr:SDR family oxidoreductase [Gordonia sp. ABSL11-1]MDL9948625.1 SDR family oxidoreductase [Gordonia sp. ABSL11-1]
MTRLKGKTALVLGASKPGNMGQTIARAFIAEGADVVVSGRDIDEANRFAELRGASALACDVRSRTEVFDLFHEVARLHGGVDVAVSTAATGLLPTTILDTTEDDVESMASTIFKGGFYFLQAAVDSMQDKGGSIITVTSAVASIMFENHGIYMGAKAGLEHLTRSVANDYGRAGIRANSIAPGYTQTPMAERFSAPGVVEAFCREIPLGRLNTAEDVANAAVFVASDECFMTGQTLHVNGGLTLRRNPTVGELTAAMNQAAATT